jgi:hypothetical protein
VIAVGVKRPRNLEVTLLTVVPGVAKAEKVGTLALSVAVEVREIAAVFVKVSAAAAVSVSILVAAV